MVALKTQVILMQKVVKDSKVEKKHPFPRPTKQIKTITADLAATNIKVNNLQIRSIRSIRKDRSDRSEKIDQIDQIRSINNSYRSIQPNQQNPDSIG